MAEKLHHKQESGGESSRDLHKHKETLQQEAEKQAEKSRHEHAENIDDIRSRIEQASKSKEDHRTKENDDDALEKERPSRVSKELKDIAYRRTMRRVQSKLPAPARAFSKLVHNPAVDAASEAAGKTIARPSGVLAGGIFAFIGSSLFLWITRHYGYEYNYLMFALFFVGGFFVGLLLEVGIKLASRRR